MGLWAHACRGESWMTLTVEGGSVMNGFLDRHRQLGTAAFLALLMLLALGCVCLQVTGRIGAIPHPTPAFPIEKLLLDESAFPEGWRATRPFDPDRRIAAEQITRNILSNKCHPLTVGATHDVYRFYGGASSAAEAYPEETAIWFSPNWGDWSIPAELSYESPVAEQYRFGCRIEQETATILCQALGQYEQYIVVFDAELDPDHPECLTFTDLERILVAIDERMALCLGKGMP
jgi:hypothetical protein